MIFTHNPNEDRIFGPETQVSSSKRSLVSESESFRICYTQHNAPINVCSSNIVYKTMYRHRVSKTQMIKNCREI